MKARAIIFDMDGVLVDTEPFWVLAQVEVFSRLGIPMTEAMCAQTTGLRIDEVVARRKQEFPWSGASIDAVAFDIVSRVMELVSQRAVLLPGVQESLALVSSLQLKIALASSSSSRLIEHILGHFGLRDCFSLCCSAEVVDFGKPHPAVYLETASALGIEPRSCVAIEDSFFGLLAAKSAQMKAIVVPEKKYFSDLRWCIAEHKLSSLLEFREKHIFC